MMIDVRTGDWASNHREPRGESVRGAVPQPRKAHSTNEYFADTDFSRVELPSEWHDRHDTRLRADLVAAGLRCGRCDSLTERGWQLADSVGYRRREHAGWNDDACTCNPTGNASDRRACPSCWGWVGQEGLGGCRCSKNARRPVCIACGRDGFDCAVDHDGIGDTAVSDAREDAHGEHLCWQCWHKSTIGRDSGLGHAVEYAFSTPATGDREVAEPADAGRAGGKPAPSDAPRYACGNVARPDDHVDDYGNVFALNPGVWWFNIRILHLLHLIRRATCAPTCDYRKGYHAEGCPNDH